MGPKAAATGGIAVPKSERGRRRSQAIINVLTGGSNVEPSSSGSSKKGGASTAAAPSRVRRLSQAIIGAIGGSSGSADGGGSGSKKSSSKRSSKKAAKGEATGFRVINLEDFKNMSSLPRFPEHKKFLMDLNSVDRELSIIIFVSHAWIRAHEKSEDYNWRPNPDSVMNDKHKLVVEGAERAWKAYAPGMRDCWIWLDHGCLDQDGASTVDELSRQGGLEKIIKACDCLLTPVIDPGWRNWSPKVPTNPDWWIDYQARGWLGLNVETAYLNRAWCTLEALYGANVALTESSETRLENFVLGFRAAMEKGSRPHLLFGTRESLLGDGQPPHILGPMPPDFFENRDPVKGLLTHPKDKPAIEKLVVGIPIKKSEGYRGKRNAYGKKHGRGKYVLPNGSRYEGYFENDLMHGKGKMLYSWGDVYEGEYQNDKFHGPGCYTWANGDSWEGTWEEGQQHGRGKETTAATGEVKAGYWDHGEYKSQCCVVA